MHRRRVSKKEPHFKFDKYELYRRSVQSPDTDVVFLRKVYRELRKKDPVSLREDFCGTHLLSIEWVKLSRKHQAIGMDIDPEPIEYGKNHYHRKLNEEQLSRLKIIEQNVLKSPLPRTDLVIAMNFSYFVFQTRQLMKSYFANVYRNLKKDGVFIMDLFGGSLCYDENEDLTKHRKFNYYWDQSNFDPVTNRAMFYIHFKPQGQKKQEKVFSYDWRMWSIPELRDILEEVGFKKSHVYWEGTTRKGEGDGVFTRTETGEACESWIAYIAAEK